VIREPTGTNGDSGLISALLISTSGKGSQTPHVGESLLRLAFPASQETLLRGYAENNCDDVA